MIFKIEKHVTPVPPLTNVSKSHLNAPCPHINPWKVEWPIK